MRCVPCMAAARVLIARNPGMDMRAGSADPPKPRQLRMESDLRKKDGVYAVKEMLSTEETYFGVLSSFVRAYIGGVEKRDTQLKREFLSDANVAVLFNNMKELHVLNEKLLCDIRSEVVARERQDDLPGAPRAELPPHRPPRGRNRRHLGDGLCPVRDCRGQAARARGRNRGRACT